MVKKTLILGASTKPQRYAHIAAEMLLEYEHEIVPVGLRAGEKVLEHEILSIQEKPIIEGIDTVTIYLGPANQKDYYQYIIDLKPKRVIFNPGTENPELIQLLQENGIENEVACTLVLLRTGQF